jgi:hypothetical protein
MGKKTERQNGDSLYTSSLLWGFRPHSAGQQAAPMIIHRETNVTLMAVIGHQVMTVIVMIGHGNSYRPRLIVCANDDYIDLNAGCVASRLSLYLQPWLVRNATPNDKDKERKPSA